MWLCYLWTCLALFYKSVGDVVSESVSEPGLHGSLFRLSRANVRLDESIFLSLYELLTGQ